MSERQGASSTQRVQDPMLRRVLESMARESQSLRKRIAALEGAKPETVEQTTVVPAGPAVTKTETVEVPAEMPDTLDLKTLRVGDVEAGNFAEFEPDGTLMFHGAATYWRDIDFPIVIRTTGANKPVLTTLIGNITAPLWIVDDYNVCEGQEFVHEWKEGSEVKFHVHLVTAVAGGGDTTDRYVAFEVEYIWAPVHGVLSGGTIKSKDIQIPANTPFGTMLIGEIGSFHPVGGRIGGHVYARLKRVTAGGTAPSTAGIYCSMLQLHVECDTAGSRDTFVK